MSSIKIDNGQDTKMGDKPECLSSLIDLWSGLCLRNILKIQMVHQALRT